MSQRPIKNFDTREPTCFSIVFENLIGVSKKRIIFNDGSFLYSDQCIKLNRYTFFDYFNDHYQETFVNNFQTPYLICTCCGSFPHLENINYDDSTINFLNKHGLNIFLYETIFLDTGNKRKSLNVLDQNVKNIDDRYNILKNSLIGFESTEENLSRMYCFDYEKIVEFVKRNKLLNVTVYSGDYQIEKYFSNIYKEIKLKTLDIYVVSLFKKTNDRFNAHEYVENKNVPNVENIQYKFWCGNRRYEGYRHLMVSYMLSKSSLCSYQHKIEDSPFENFDIDKKRNGPIWGDVQNYLWFNFSKWKNMYPEIYETIQHGMIKIKEKNSISMDCDITQKKALESLDVPEDFYHRCFCAVVTEARYAIPTGNFSEKTMNAIKCFRPFILVAPPKTLEYLKKYNIKTFGDYWDESYDLEENHEQRLIKVFKTIEQIDKFSIKELKLMYKDMANILTHNYHTIANISKIPFNK